MTQVMANRGYIAYPKALAMLAQRLNATPEKLAAWVFMGPGLGGLSAYLNANELDEPPTFYYHLDRHGDFDYVSPLMGCWFREDDIAHFKPAAQFITGKELIERWSVHPGVQPEAFIRAKITESRLLDMHPISGQTQGTNPGDSLYPPLVSGLFNLAEVEAIEADDFGLPAGEQANITDNQQTARSRKEPLDQAAIGKECEIFRAMENLSASEVSIAFVGDKSESGLAANNMLEVSARNVTRRVPLVALDLVDRRCGILNKQAAMLLGMAKGRCPLRNDNNAKKVARLRKLLRGHLGVQGDPFGPYRKDVGWEPRFKVTDRRGAADLRARKEGERRTVSYEDHKLVGSDLSGNSYQDDMENEDDMGGKWLKDNDREEPV